MVLLMEVYGMNPLISKFVEKVLQPIKYQKIHPHIAREIEDHLEFLKEDYREEGLEEEEAYKRAIAEMGDATIIGKALHKIHKPKMEWSILILIAALISISCTILYLWNGHYAGHAYAHNVHIKQMIFVAVGVILVSSLYFLDYRSYEKWGIAIWCLGHFILVWILFSNVTINGVSRWIRIGPVILSGYGLGRLFLMMGYVGIIHRWGNMSVKRRFVIGLLPFLPLGLIAKGNLFDAVIMGSMFLAIITFYITSKGFKGNKLKWLSMLYGGVVAGGGLLSFMLFHDNPYRNQRMLTFINPEIDPSGAGYMYVVMKRLRESARFIGDSGFNIIDGYLPLGGASSDLIFTFIVAKLGWLTGGILIMILLVVIFRLYVAAWQVHEAYGRLICLSIASLFTLQITFNICMNLGYLPITTSNLPFVSYGGSAMVTDMMMIGIFLSIYRKKDILDTPYPFKKDKVEWILEKMRIRTHQSNTREIAKQLALLNVNQEVIEKATGLTHEEVKRIIE